MQKGNNTHLTSTKSHVCPHGHVKPELSAAGKRTRSDFHKVAFRPRESPFPMLNVEEALQVVLEHTPVLGHEVCGGLQSM